MSVTSYVTGDAHPAYLDQAQGWMVMDLVVMARQSGEGAACHHPGDELSWMSRSPSPSEHGGSPYSGPLPGSVRGMRHFRDLHEIMDLNRPIRIFSYFFFFTFFTNISFGRHVSYFYSFFSLVDTHMNFG